MTSLAVAGGSSSTGASSSTTTSTSTITKTKAGGGAGSGVVDRRVAPDYDLLFKEKVSAQDVYLGMDFARDGSSAMCEGMIIKFMMPKTDKASDIELDVEKRAVLLRSRDYLVKVDLPHKVIEQKAGAKWDADKKTLSVTVTIDHDPNEVKLM